LDFNIDIVGLIKAYQKDDFWEVISSTSMSRIPEVSTAVEKEFHVKAKVIAWQIESYKKAVKKYPSVAIRGILFPPPINLSQSSSELTAQFKSKLLREHAPFGVIDCTGGFGLDSFAFLKAFGKCVYCEKSEGLRNLFRANTAFLEYMDVEIKDDYVKSKPLENWAWFADPSRRDESGARVFNIDEFSPNPLHVLERFTTLPGLLKLPPMLDINFVLETFPSASELFVVSVRNECKELLLHFNPKLFQATKVKAIALSNTSELCFENVIKEEIIEYTSLEQLLPGDLLYVPDVALSKAQLVDVYAVEKKMLAIANLGLFKQTNPFDEVMGKTLQLIDIIPFKQVPKAIKQFKRINVAVSQDFPIKANELERKFKIIPGGDHFLYGVRNQKGKSYGIIAKWINLST